MPGELNLDKDSYTKDEVAALVAEANKGLEANRNESLTEAKKLRDRLKGFDGIDPEEVKTMRAEREKLAAANEKAEAERLEAAGNWKAREEQLTKKHADQIAKEQSEKGKLLSNLDKKLKDAAAIAELAKHSDTPGLLLPHVLGQMKVIEEDGEYVARIVDAKGNIRIGTGKGAEPMTLPELMDEMKLDKGFAPAFRGTGSSGGGAARSNAGGGGAKVVAAGDNASFIANLKDIASGAAEVR